MTTQKLRFACPSCGSRLDPIEPMDHATTIVRRTCHRKTCRETWQLKVVALRVEEGIRFDKAEFTFIGRRRISHAV